jgi:hypothetical protein
VRVERLAKDKLQMHQANPAITTYVSYSGSAEKSAQVQGAAVRQEAAQ